MFTRNDVWHRCPLLLMLGLLAAISCEAGSARQADVLAPWNSSPELEFNQCQVGIGHYVGVTPLKLTGNINNVQNAPEGPLPDGFNFNPTVGWAFHAVGLQPYYADCLVTAAHDCTIGHVNNMQSAPSGPLPNGFDFNPTVGWILFEAGLQPYYVTCVAVDG